MTPPLKKLLTDCFETLADGPKTGLLAARAISNCWVAACCSTYVSNWWPAS